MKKVLLAVILSAAAGGVYYLLRHKSQPTNSVTQNNRLTGQWYLDSVRQLTGDTSANTMLSLLLATDTSLTNSRYVFQGDGTILKTKQGYTGEDTSRYYWITNNQLVWYEHAADTTDEKLSVSLPDEQHLVLTSTDSAALFFSKRLQ